MAKTNKSSSRSAHETKIKLRNETLDDHDNFEEDGPPSTAAECLKTTMFDDEKMLMSTVSPPGERKMVRLSSPLLESIESLGQEPEQQLSLREEKYNLANRGAKIKAVATRQQSSNDTVSFESENKPPAPKTITKSKKQRADTVAKTLVLAAKIQATKHDEINHEQQHEHPISDNAQQLLQAEQNQIIPPGAYAMQPGLRGETDPLTIGFLSPQIPAPPLETEENHNEDHHQHHDEAGATNQQQQYVGQEMHASVEGTVVAVLVHDTNTADNSDNTDSRQEVKALKKQVIWFGVGLVVLFLVVIGAVVGGIFGGLQANNTPPVAPTFSPSDTGAVVNLIPSLDLSSFHPSQAPTLAFQGQLIPLIQSRSPKTIFEDLSSPQSLALDWMLNHDEYSQSFLLDSSDRLIQRFALVTLWYATGGPTTWGNNGLGWLNATSPECEWNLQDFVYCYTNGLVTVLNLREDRLSQSLPMEIGLLTTLQILNVFGNALGGTVPSEMGQLSAIIRLNIAGNGLVGSLPSEIGQLSALTRLDARINALNGSLPTELGQLSALEALILGLNRFNGTFPTELGRLLSLTFLGLRENLLVGTLPSEIGQLTALTVLNLAENQFRGSIPPEWKSLTNLTNLFLFETDLTGILPSELCNNGSLRPRIDCGRIVCDCCVDEDENPCP